MKYLTVCCVLVAVLQVRTAPLTNEQKTKLDTYHQECAAESNVSKLLIEKSRKGIFTDDPAFKNFLFCFSQKAGFQDANGTVQKDVFEKKVKMVVGDEALVSKLVEQCTAQKDTPQETSFYIAKCLREVAPHIELFKVASEVIYLPNEKTRQVLLQHKECASQDPLGEEAIEQARRQGVLFEDAKFKDYIYCFSKKSGIQRDDGSINRDLFYKKFGEVIENPVVVEALGQKCLLEQDTPANTALFVSKCIHENSPVHLEIFPRELPIPEEEAKQIIAHGRACIKETGIDREILEKSRQGIFSEDPIYKEFTFCMGKQAGFINEAGDVLRDVLKEKSLKLFNDPNLVQKLIDQCVVKKSTPQETSYHAHVCFYKNSPGHLALTQFGAISQEKKEKKAHIIKECAEESGVSRSAVLSARKGDFQDEPLLKQYFFCINKKSEILNEAGEYKTDVIRKDLTEIFNAEEANRIVEKCARIQDSPLNTAFEGLKCFYNEAPEITGVF